MFSLPSIGHRLSIVNAKCPNPINHLDYTQSIHTVNVPSTGLSATSQNLRLLGDMVAVVSYQTRRIRVPYEPSTLLSSIRTTACGLLELNPQEYGLRSGKRELDLTLSYRMSNLITNANLELFALPRFSLDDEVRIKLRLQSSPDVISTFAKRTSIAEILTSIGQDSSKVNAVLSDTALDPNDTLAQLGAKGSMVLSLRPKPKSAEPVTTPITHSTINQVNNGAQSDDAKVAGNPDENLDDSATTNRRVEVGVGSGLANGAAGEVPNMTEGQFMTYYSHLKNEAAPRQMIFRTTKQRLAEEKRSKITSVAIRIRLPDENFIQGTFSPTETGAHVYDFLKTSLREPGAEFVLESASPRMILEKDIRLIDIPHFETRMMFYYKGNIPLKGPVLNDEAMALKKSQEQSVDASATASLETPSKSGKTSALPKQPKWMKKMFK